MFFLYNLIIVGAGGCGREIYEMLPGVFSADEYNVKGFLSDNLTILDEFSQIKEKAPILGTIADYNIQENDRFILAIGDVTHRGDMSVREKVARILLKRNAKFINFIHPTAQVLPSAKLGTGLLIYPYALVGSNVIIEDFVMISAFATCGQDSTVGEYTIMCPYSCLLGNSTTGRNCFLGTHSTLAPTKSIGNNCRISANSAALRDAPDDTFICGVPGKNM